uniref:TSA: Wollemia nobilis Ref_Wollemi_Transcript_25714_1122 transcribed RNA sequence n=1 Tax=Wollemia nobilis TaxID=56998 RepID=A0A0C9S486_9CONI
MPMAANILHQVSGPIKGILLPSKPKLALSLSFSSAMNLKGQSVQMCAPLNATLVSGSRCTCLSAFTKKNIVIAYAQSGNSISESEEEGDTENEAALSEESDIQNESASSETTTLVETEEQPKPPRKRRIKLGEIIGILNKRAVEAVEKERSIPDIRTGDILELKVEVPETRRRVSTYKGIVMSRQNAGIHTTIRVRRIIAGVGTEIVFPLYSPIVKQIKVVKHRKVRRARLYYLRDKLPRLSTFK